MLFHVFIHLCRSFRFLFLAATIIKHVSLDPKCCNVHVSSQENSYKDSLLLIAASVLGEPDG